MEYTSIRSQIWERLKNEGSRRGNIVQREEFDRVCEAFGQAEECRFSGEVVDAVKWYRAEYNIWGYYFGEEAPFPGKDPGLVLRGQTLPLMPTNTETQISPEANLAPYPSPDTAASHLSPPMSVGDLNNPAICTAATQMRNHLNFQWHSREAWKGYTPQLGFDPSTGEPWMSVRCYASNGYPALSGSHHRYLHTFEKQIPEFDIRYERFEEYILIWPEFKKPVDMFREEVWERVGRLRLFLGWWAGGKGKGKGVGMCMGMGKWRVEVVCKAFRDWVEGEGVGQRGLDIPEGFVVEECRGWKAALGMQERAERRKRGEVVEEPEMEVFPRRLKWHKRKGDEKRERERMERASREEKDSCVEMAQEMDVHDRRYSGDEGGDYNDGVEHWQSNNSKDHREETQRRGSSTGHRDEYKDRVEHFEVNDRRDSLEEHARRSASPSPSPSRKIDYRVQRGRNSTVIDRYRPAPRTRHDERHRSSRSRSGGREVVDRYRSRRRANGRSGHFGEIDRYRPRY